MCGPHCERFVRTIKEEALSKHMILGESHLRRVVREFLAHYDTERHHQGLGSELIEPDETANRRQGAVACRERLGGLLRYYYRDAA